MAAIQRAKSKERHQDYSLSMIAAMSESCVIAAQVTEGGTDAVVFENFLHRVLSKLRVDKETKSKQ